MPINTDLNIAPYFDDFDVEKQFYKILFKPAYAVQARELTQLQTILQNQVEQFGDNIYQEGSIIKGCNFTDLNGLQFVKLTDKTGFDVESYISGPDVEIINGVETEIDVKYEVYGTQSGLKASIITAQRGFETRPPDLNTFFITYLNTNEASGDKTFRQGENLQVNKYKYNGKTLISTELNIANINVTLQTNSTGKSFGIQASAGVIFQKGHFLFTADQTLVVSKYTNIPDDRSVGYEVIESTVSALQDNSLYDNANGSKNENAPGADRLRMVPVLVAKDTADADVDANFFTLIRYQNGSAVRLRDVSQFNSIAQEMAKRTYEESGNYILENFKVDLERRDNDLTALLGKGVAYVKGYRVENSGKQDFTIDQIANTAIQQNVGTTVDYGSYVDVVDISGTIDLNYGTLELQNTVGSKIGEAYARNVTPTRLYLFGIKMISPNSFDQVVRVVGASGNITVASNSRLKDVNKSPIIFETGTPYIKEITDTSLPVREHKSVTVTNDTIEITANPGEDFALNQDDIVVVDTSNSLIPVSSWSTSLNNSVLTINLDPAANSDPGAEVYYNRRITAAEPHNKAIVEPYVKVNFVSGTNQYSLGFPDVFKVLQITDGVGGNDYTDSFKLHTNQNDHFYDISYIEYIPGRPKPPNSQLVIKLQVFQVNVSTGDYFFTINSYPIDDDSETLPAGKVRSWDLDTYRSSNGSIYNLRNSIDYRPHVDHDPLVAYTDTTTSAAGVVTTAVGALNRRFSGSNYIIPPLKSNAISDIEAYLSRVDAIAVDSYGVASIIKGEEAEIPVTPLVNEDQLILAKIYIPGYPALSPQEAAESGKNSSAVQIKPQGTKNYTMREIEKLEKRIEGMEYYISLNQLEQESENLTILDENGLTRFKNGYIVDPMNDPGISNLDDPNYSAAIHFNKQILTPELNTFPLDLKYKSSSGASVFPSVNDAEVGTLSRNANVRIIGQPYATNFRNCVSNFWKYDGQGSLSPSHDMAHDTVTNPVPVEIDLLTPFQDLQRTWPLTDVQWGNVSEGPSFRRGRQRITPRTQAGTILSLDVNDGGLNKVGDFVTDVRFQPFMRSRPIRVYVSGLRPNTRHYFFFDGKDVNAHVTPGNVNAATSRSVFPFGRPGQAVETDDRGVLRAVFVLPAGQFYVGDRVLTIVDVSQYSSIDSAATSKCELTYHAYNMQISKSTLSTRVPEFEIDREATSRNLAARVVNLGDPLAQTFFIKKGMGRGSNTVFISKVDLYFKRKSDTNGVTITLREVVNGYPSGVILPFSKIHIDATDVNVSDDSSAVTEVFFDAPVRMEVEKEYAIVIMPDANDPNYLHFTSKVGGTDLTPGTTNSQPVVHDWGDGVLFTSTNNSAWKSVQDEDIKFNIYRHDFNAATGTITLTNNDHEFFTLSDWDGRFNLNEMVYKETDTGYSVNMVRDTNVITQSGNDFNVDYAAGDYILLTTTTGVKDIFRIASVDSSTQMTTDRPCAYNNISTGTPIVAGEISHYDKYNRSELHLKASSATTSKKFAVGDTIFGLTSGVEATIGSIDDINLSYVQPMIQRVNDTVTTTSINGTFVDPNNTINTYNMPMKFGDNNFFTSKGVIVYSKSNNLFGSYPFDINIEMTNSSNITSTPFIDMEISSLLAYQFITTDTVDTAAKYISKTVTLAEDLDAEDMNLYLTGYRPNGTDIKVYIRPKHAQDSTPFDSIDWIELELFEGVNTYSSSSNLDDFREFRFRVASTNKDGSGVLQYTSESGTFSGYRTFAIRIDLIANNIHNVPFVKDYRGIALT